MTVFAFPPKESKKKKKQRKRERINSGERDHFRHKSSFNTTVSQTLYLATILLTWSLCKEYVCFCRPPEKKEEQEIKQLFNNTRRLLTNCDDAVLIKSLVLARVTRFITTEPLRFVS